MMFSIRTVFLAALVSALVAALIGAKLASDYQTAVCNNQINTMRLESERAVTAHQAKVIEQEHALTQLRNQLETDHAEAQDRVNHTLEENRRLVRLAGGLRDPGRRPDACAAVPSASGASGSGDTSTGGAVLSGEAENFLLEFAAEADRVVEQYRTCQSWAVSIGGGQHGSH